MRSRAPSLHNAIATRLPSRLQRKHMGAHRLEDVCARLGAFGREIVPAPRTHFDRIFLRHPKWREPRQRRSIKARFPFLFAEIQPFRRQRLVDRRDALLEGIAARIVIVGYLRKTLMRRVFGEVFKRDSGPREIIEQRLEPVVKQRQPMLHAGIAAAFAHRFIEQVVGRRRAELRNVTRAKAADRLGDELELRHRHKVEPPELLFAALGLRVEDSYCFQGVAEKVEADGHVHARRIKVEDAAAHGILARLPHGRGARKSVQLEPIDDPLHADDIAGRNRQCMRRHEVTRRDALERGIDRRQQDGRLVAPLHANKARQCGHALRDHGGIRRDTVVGQTVPCREFHDLDIGAEKDQRARQRRHALSVPANDGERHGRRILAGSDRPREIGEHKAFGAVRDLRQDERLTGLQQRRR